jgi:hypothetical protein
VKHTVLPCRLPSYCCNVHQRLLPISTIIVISCCCLALTAAARTRHTTGVALLSLPHLHELAPGIVCSKTQAITDIQQHICVLQ